MNDINFTPLKTNELVANEALVTINNNSKSHKMGIYEVAFSYIKIDKNRDGKLIATISFKQLNDKSDITILRNFIEDRPYKKEELSYDIMHDFFSLLGIKNSRKMIESSNFNYIQFEDQLRTKIGTKLIIAIYNEYKSNNEIDSIFTRLRLVTSIDGYSFDELQVNHKSRDELFFIADRLCPAFTIKYLQRNDGIYVEEDKDITLLNRKFQNNKEEK